MIYFKTIRYQNILSTGNQFTEVKLDRSSTTLIIGENGAGKSTLLDALLFVLYGTPYRDINKPQLVNSLTGKNLLVELDFTIGKNNYMVRRGIKPSVFEIYINDKMVEQNASIREYQEHLEKNILKLNKKSFTQIIVVGSANFTPFMQLRTPQRREVIEDLLDIEIFSKMNVLAKERLSVKESDLKAVNYSLDILTSNMELTQKHLKELQEMRDVETEEKKKKIVDLKEKINDYKQERDTMLIEVQELEKKTNSKNSFEEKMNKLRSYEAQFKQSIDKLDNEITFFANNDICPTCTQEISNEFKSDTVHQHTIKKDEFNDAMGKLWDQQKEIQKRLAEIHDIQVKINELQGNIMTLTSNISIYENSIAELTRDIESAKVKEDPESEEKLKHYKEQIGKANRRKEKIINDKELLSQALGLLKDGGIKTKIIKQYVPIINKLINKYLASMDFFIQFQLDEQFNETIKSRFRDDFTYASFSEGEKARIDLALIMTWRAVAKLRNSASSNLLIMDEVFDGSLDSVGSDALIKIIDEIEDDSNIFVISHKGDVLFDKFRSVIKFEKKKNFSRMA